MNTSAVLLIGFCVGWICSYIYQRAPQIIGGIKEASKETIEKVRTVMFDLALKYNTTKMFEGTRFHDDTIRAMHKLGVLPKDYDMKVIEDVK